jgi:hypothetical protein
MLSKKPSTPSPGTLAAIQLNLYKMRIITSICLIFFVNMLFGQKIDLNERLDYLNRHHLFVVKVELEPSLISKKKKDRIENSINNNIKMCLDTFWDLNDSICYIETKDLEHYKKKFHSDLFLNYKLSNDYVFNISNPDSTISLNDISPRLFSDTTLLGITQELRQLIYNIKHGNVLFDGFNNNKIILILDEPVLNDYHQKFIDRYKTKYPNNFLIVSRQFMNSAVYSRDPGYIYIYNLFIINCADGSMIQI